MPNQERQQQPELPIEIRQQIAQAVQTMPTLKEARRRTEYEATAGLANENRLFVFNKAGRVILPPESYEMVGLILEKVGFSKDERNEIITTERKRAEKAREVGVTVLRLMINFVDVGNRKVKVNVETTFMQVGRNKDALKQVPLAPDQISDQDRNLLERLDS